MENPYLLATKKWIETVVIGLNICPFAQKVFEDQRIRFEIETSQDIETCLETVIAELAYLDDHPSVETTLICYAKYLTDFNDYLDFLTIAQALLKELKYEGIYQLASFHPNYLFAETYEDDAANYTNRSPYPMLHILREESITHALKRFPNPEQIPQQNVVHARQLGLAKMQQLLSNCLPYLDKH
jgi:hypothetical protein